MLSGGTEGGIRGDKPFLKEYHTHQIIERAYVTYSMEIKVPDSLKFFLARKNGRV
jgi:hypothetical protein